MGLFRSGGSALPKRTGDKTSEFEANSMAGWIPNSLRSAFAKCFWIGLLFGGLSFVAFTILFWHLVSQNPALDPVTNSTEGSRAFRSSQVVFFASVASCVGAMLCTMRYLALQASIPLVRILVSTAALALWALLYSPAMLLLLNFAIVDFVKYDQSFRDLATGSVLDLERSYLLLLRWGVALQVLFLPLYLLLSIKQA